MAEKQHEVVIIGGGFAGVSLTHELIKKHIPALKKTGSTKFRITMISMSTHFWFVVATVRAIAAPELIAPEALATPLSKLPYGPEVFTFVHGEVISLDFTTKQVQYKPLDGKPESREHRSVPYDSLFIVPGSHSKDPSYKLRTSHEAAIAAVKDLHDRVESASSIVIGGGGPISVEQAGELGSKYGKSKSITIITNSERLLPSVSPDIGTTAAGYLKTMGVHVKTGSKIASTEKLADGRTKITLHDGESYEVDVYIDATGVIPNSSFLPKDLLDESGFLIVDEYMRVAVPGGGVFAMGDIVNGMKQIVEVMFSLPIVAANWANEVSGGKLGELKPFKRPAKSVMVVPVGRKKAVMAVFGWRLPSFLGWFLKGRTFMIDKAVSNVTG